MFTKLKQPINAVVNQDTLEYGYVILKWIGLKYNNIYRTALVR